MPKKIQLRCWDCGTEIKHQKKELIDAVALKYPDFKDIVYKCKKCYDKPDGRELKNFQPVECYSRVVGYLRPISQWNKGKQLEYKQRKVYKTKI